MVVDNSHRKSLYGLHTIISYLSRKLNTLSVSSFVTKFDDLLVMTAEEKPYYTTCI